MTFRVISLISTPFASVLRLLGVVAFAGAVTGCAHFEPLPTSALKPEFVAPPDQAWTLPTATAFALQHNPNVTESTLRLMRARQEAGLAKVPPPVNLGFSLDHPWQTGVFNAFALSASADLSFWLRHAPRDEAIKAKLRQAILNERWQTWQLAAAVQQQYISLWYLHAQHALLAKQITWAQQRLNEAEHASQAGLITAPMRLLTQASLDQWQQKATTLQLQSIKEKAQFSQLLGLPADGSDSFTLTAPKAIFLPEAALKSSGSAERPDVLALKAAIDEQDANYRTALIEQFPSISLGVTRAQDTSRVQTIGLGVNLVIPMFDGNRHAIAIAKTNRALAAAQYRHRLMQVQHDFAALKQKQAALKSALAQIQQKEPATQAALQSAEQALRLGLVNANTVDTLRQTQLDQQLLLLQYTADLLRADYALPALVGIAPNTQDAVAQVPKTHATVAARP